MSTRQPNLMAAIASAFFPHPLLGLPLMTDNAIRANITYRVEVTEVWRTTTCKMDWKKLTDTPGVQQYGDVERDVEETGARVVFVAESSTKPSLVALAQIVEGSADR